METFLESVRELAEGSQRAESPGHGERVPAEGPVADAIGSLYGLAVAAAREYNDAAGSQVLQTLDLPSIVLRVFLNFKGARRGFCIIGPRRLVTVVDDPPGGVLVLGRTHTDTAGDTPAQSRTIQLIHLRVSPDGAVLRDSTGVAIEGGQVLLGALQWVIA